MNNQNQSLREQASKGGRWTGYSAIVGIAVQLAQLAILGRTLEPADFGLMAMMLFVIGVANSIADFGLGNYLIQVETLTRRLFLRVIVIVSSLSLTLSIAIAASSSLIAEYYKQPSLTELLPLLASSVVMFTLSQLFMSVLQRVFLFRIIAIGEMISVGVSLASTTLMSMSGYGAWSLVLGTVLGSSVRAIVFGSRVVSLLETLPVENQPELSSVKAFALYQTGERVLNYVGSNLEKVIIGRVLGEVSLGYYTIAYQLMVKPFSILNPIFTRVALPLFSSIRSDNDRLGSGYLQIVKTIAIIVFPLYIIMAICAPSVVVILMGESWRESAPMLYVLSFVGMMFSIGNPIGSLILAKGQPKISFYFNIVSTLLLAIAFWIGSRYSALGVAIGYLIVVVCILYPLEFYIRFKLVRMSIREYFRSLGHVFIAAAIPISVHAALYLPDMHPSSLSDQVALAAFSIAFFFAYLLKFERPFINSTKSLFFK